MPNPAPGFRARPDHKVLVDSGPDAVTVRYGDAIVAASTAGLVVREDGYPARAYVPRDDVDVQLIPSEHTTYCPFKGRTVYFHVTVAGTRLADAAWSYPEPYDEMERIAGHVAFDDRFEIAIG
ncbi:DUF427 domain-containing protein [Acuticoccus mangrovi]|uniref:DUF427 domain-containing protein n=1 Tax=Acuticoccus mangrovi TaxID=2796142 RepID=A0A934IIR4_9HYPH|nr:DUF427 domain-containing protein [Acuticoccus mangrovi]MBJ3777228.1 DUF427 domain-containing protein [Acuticoccus mangrovi]